MRPVVAESQFAEAKSSENEAASEDAPVPTHASVSAGGARDVPPEAGRRPDPEGRARGAGPGDDRGLRGARERERAGAAAAAPMASSVRQDERLAGDVSVPESERAFERLEASRPRTGTEWRRLRDAWSGFAAAHPEDPRADEARVRAIEAGREAWLAGGADDDKAGFERDARSYLGREDARQQERVERLLTLPIRRP